MDIQVPYPNSYSELITAHDSILESLGQLSNAPERARASRQSKADLEMWKLAAWGISLILEQDVRILRDLDKDERERIDVFNLKLKEALRG
jgi:hypothetical protein